MHLSTTAPNQPQYSFNASKLPNVSMVGPCHLPSPQPQPQSSNNVQSPVIISSQSCTPAYTPQTLPPFSTSFQAAFASSAPQPHQPIPLANAWNPTPVTVLPNRSSCTHLNPPTEIPFRIPVVANVTTTHYEPSQSPPPNPTLPPLSAPVTESPTPSLYPTHVCPSHDTLLVRLPSVPSNVPTPPFPLVTLPRTSHSFPTHVHSGVPPAAAPPTTTTPSRKPRTKRKKQAPTAKRSRAKTPAATATRRASTATGATTTRVPLPLVGGQRKGSSLPPSRKSREQTLNKGHQQNESIPSPSVLPNRTISLTTPKPHQPTLGLNFADVVLEKPSYRAESARLRYEASTGGLKARENATRHLESASTPEASRVYSEANKTPADDSVDPQLATRMLHASSQSVSAAGGASVAQSVKDLPSRRPTANRRTCSGSKRGKDSGSMPKARTKPKEVSTSLPAMVVPQGSEKFPGEEEISPTGSCPGTSTFGSDNCGVSNMNNGWNGGDATGKGNATMLGTNGNPTTPGLETSGIGASGSGRPCNEAREETAAETLMTLAGTLVPMEINCRQGHEKVGKEMQRAGAWNVNRDDGNKEGERGSTANSKSKRGSSLKTNGSLQNCAHKGDTGMQMDSNFGNFLNREWHLQSSAHQLPQSNASQFTYSATIPGHSPSPVNDTPRPAQNQLRATSVPYQEKEAVYAEGTPVDIRQTPNLFSRLPTSSLPHTSRNRSLTQEASVLGQCLTTLQEAGEKISSHLPRSSSDIRNTLHHPPHVARPLFQEGSVVQPTLSSQNHFPVSHVHGSQLKRYHTMHQAANLTQPVEQLLPPPTSTDLPTPQHQTPSAAIVHSQPSLPQESSQDGEPESMPQTTKPPIKQRTPRDPSKATKPPKATSERSSAKNPKPRRPRRPKKTSTTQPSTTNSVPSAQAPPKATAPLRLRASFSAKGAADPPMTGSLPSSGSVSHHQPVHEIQSTEAHVSANSLHDLPPLPEVHRDPTSSAVRKPSHHPKRDAAPAISKRTKSSKPRPRKTPVKKTSASIEKAIKAADKAARSGRNPMLCRTKEPEIDTPPSNRTPQIVKVQPPAPPESLQPEATICEAGIDDSTSAQPHRSLQAFDMRGRDGGPQANDSTPQNPISGGMLSTKEAQMGSAFAHNVGVSSGTPGDHDASSPRTESTQQTSPPDTSSDGPSETENLFVSDDVTLAHAKSNARISSRSTVPNLSVKIVRAKGNKNCEGRNTSRQRSTSVPADTEADTVIDKAGYTSSPLPTVDSSPTTSRKRQNNAKSLDANKKRKRSSASNLHQISSKGDKGVLPLRAEDTGHLVVDAHQEGLLEPNKTSSAKKSTVRVQTKNKVTRHPTTVRKRPSSSTKTQTKEESERNGTTNLRLCLSVREKNDQPAPAPETNGSGFSCGSPVTPDKVRHGFRYASKPPQKGGRVRKNCVEMGRNRDDNKAQNTPCFAEELKNLRVSGLLKTRDDVSSPSLPEDLPCGISSLPTVLCVLCQKQSHNEIIKHPCFPVRAFDVCKACADIVSKRVEEHGAKRRTLPVPSEEALTQRTTLFVMLIEEMVRHFAPSDHEHRDIKEIYDFIKNRSFGEMAERAETLSVNLDMLTVLRVTLRKVGFTIRGGKLRWPAGVFTLPTLADTRALVSHALPARIEDLRKGILPGEAAWNETFGKDQNLARQGSSSAIYEKVLGLVGLRMVHMTDCNTQDSSTGSCKVKLDAVSMGVLMYRTAVMLSGTVMRELLAASWTKEEAFRFINETEIKLYNGPYEGTVEPCCICGVSEKPQKESNSFRFSKCTECLKSFCSVCLLNVLGTSEYLRSFGDGGYFCMMCRFQKNAELCPSGKQNRGEYDRRLRLHNIAGIKKKSERRIQAIPPLLLLSPTIRADILLRPQSCNNARKQRGIAKFCEVANDNCVRNAMGIQGGQAYHRICLECKLPAEREEKDRSECEVLICGHENCINVMHKTCLAPQRQARRRGSRSKWSCPHHQCSKCDQRDELKLLRCRTCPLTFCKDHMPSPSEVYLFSERSFACSTCRSFLRVPQLLRLKPQASKSERKRNQFAQALVIDQRKRNAAVRKLSEGQGCHQGASSSFSEFRRELETK